MVNQLNDAMYSIGCGIDHLIHNQYWSDITSIPIWISGIGTSLVVLKTLCYHLPQFVVLCQEVEVCCTDLEHLASQPVSVGTFLSAEPELRALGDLSALFVFFCWLGCPVFYKQCQKDTSLPCDPTQGANSFLEGQQDCTTTQVAQW